jgi:transcriptional regulator with XRE-family HTH domain
VSAYSLGTSLPDIEKFEKIAEYFDVSTEYLLGRTDIRKPDMDKQAVSGYLCLSEKAIDKIRKLQGNLYLEQNLENDFKLTVKEAEPLSETFSDWLECVDLPDLISNLWRSGASAGYAQDSGWHPEHYMLDNDKKAAIAALKEQGYVTLTLTQQVSFFSQTAIEIFHSSVDNLISGAIQTVNEINAAEKSEDGGDAQ